MDQELPTMNVHTLSCSNYTGTAADFLYRPPSNAAGPYQPRDYQNVQVDERFKGGDLIRSQMLREKDYDAINFIKPAPVKEKKMAEPKYRVVRIYIVDTDENVPLDKSLIFTGEEKFTDATDQELFFDVDIKKILTEHNAYRQSVLDKKQTNKLGKEIYLEPIKIRDLTMTVVNVATF